jgi:hypothetical protein
MSDDTIYCPLCEFFGRKAQPTVEGRGFCQACIDEHEEKRRRREAHLATLPRMTWEEWTHWLFRYGHLVGLDIEWARETYERFGKHLPYAAGPGDGGYDLECALACREQDRPDAFVDTCDKDWLNDLIDEDVAAGRLRRNG